MQLKAGAQPFTLDELRAFLADKIGRHELPAHLEFRDALPKTAVGKLSKKELIEEERQKMQGCRRVNWLSSRPRPSGREPGPSPAGERPWPWVPDTSRREVPG